MDNLTKAWSCLSLSNREGSDLYPEEEEAVLEFVILAKFLTKHALNIDTIAKTSNPIWRSRNGFKENMGLSNPGIAGQPNLSNLNFTNPNSVEGKISHELFEASIQEINCYLYKFDSIREFILDLDKDTNRENILDSYTINERSPPSKVYSRAIHSNPPICVPLSSLSDISGSTEIHERRWKWIARIDMGTNIIMEEAVGDKRATRDEESQPELLKSSRLVSQICIRSSAKIVFWLFGLRLSFGSLDAKPTVLVVEKLGEAGLKLLKEFANVDCSYNLSPEELSTKISLCDAIIVRSGTKVSREVFESSAGRLKVVGRAGVGIDNVDLAAAIDHGCLVVNAQTANTVAAVEHGIALLAAMARNVAQADASVKAGQ
ncbi:hypothetical protein SO802_016587 [Lithocarpus litseifolius]|uniref:D-isomer specific 2-hydroxyacid dehydrogenase catalytic domain-containing protein n=1 Tax=Lithocarpus litseifolius TaxID=425828 RepID=A0AAW2D0M1_9ROSI